MLRLHDLKVFCSLAGTAALFAAFAAACSPDDSLTPKASGRIIQDPAGAQSDVQFGDRQVKTTDLPLKIQNTLRRNFSPDVVIESITPREVGGERVFDMRLKGPTAQERVVITEDGALLGNFEQSAQGQTSKE
jgi:hypothetical protein